MKNEIKMSEKTKKDIAEFFHGDTEGSVYKYRTGSNIITMYRERFEVPNLIIGPSRWTFGVNAIDFMQEKGEIDRFFTTMLSLKAIGHELDKKDQTECAKRRRKAIEDLNDILQRDDLELIEVANNLVLHKIEDENEFIGSGGFAKVYRIPGTNRVVKRLKDEFKGNASIVSRFKYEFHLVNDKLQNIKGIIEVFLFDEEGLSYTMEYCNSDLKRYIETTSLDENERLDLVIRILEIMEKVHARKVLHRDISPKNIFIKNKHPIIADFGLGKAIDENGRTYATIDTSCNGTLEYCDPRQFQGLGFADEQSDIYSLGRIINYIMTGNSDNFRHSLTFVSTVAVETSLDARFHSVKEMLDKVNAITRNKKDSDYFTKCENLINEGVYRKDMDDYLLSLEADELMMNLNKNQFRAVYEHVATNTSFKEIIIERFTTLKDIFKNPKGHTFKLFSAVSNFCVDILRNHKEIATAVKIILADCIYEVTVGMEQWNAQAYFRRNYDAIEPEYVQNTVREIKNWNNR